MCLGTWVTGKILESIQVQGKGYTDGTPMMATHLRGQSCKVRSCQWDISGNLDTEANKRLMEKEGIPGDRCKTGDYIPPTLAHCRCSHLFGDN